jgi:SanA protein
MGCPLFLIFVIAMALFYKKNRRRVTVKRFLVFLFCATVLLVVWANAKVMGYRDQAFSQVDALPTQKACLVLGASKYVSSGAENSFYRNRMAAAKQMFDAGKCAKIVVSGDNRRSDYNEPEDMKQSLVALGVPQDRIHCDYAGGRTLDSVLRFKHIFGQASGIVVSQAFHNERAIYIGQAHGMALVGFNAQEVDLVFGLRTQLREVFSRVRAVLDVEVFHSNPRHYGEAIAL